METRANYIVVGVFVLAVIAGGFGFAWWLLRGSEIGDRADVTVIFPVAVNGLATGNPVTYNGIRVGEVKRLDFSKEDPNLVIAVASVDRRTPLKRDTAATLGLLGLTGGTQIQLSGGSIDAPPLLAGDQPAVIIADRSELQDIVTAARNVLSRADTTLQTIESIVRDNGPAVGRIVRNAETFTDALAKNADGVDRFMTNVGRAAEVLEKVSGKVETLVTDLDTLVRSVEPGSVTRIVQNVEKITQDVARASGDIDGIFADVKSAVASLKDAAGTIGGAAEDVKRITAGVDPDKVKSLVDDIAGTASYLRGKTGDFDEMLARASRALGDAGDFLATLSASRADIAATIADARRIVGEVSPDKVRDAVEGFTALLTDARRVVAAVEPDKVRAVVDDIAGTTAFLRSKQPEVEDILARTRQTMADAQTFAAELADRREDITAVINEARRILAEVTPGKIKEAVDGLGAVMADAGALMTDARKVVAAVEPEKVRAVVDDIAGTTAFLKGKQGDVEEILGSTRQVMTDAREFTAELAARRQDVAAVITEARRILGEVTPGKVKEAVEALGGVMTDASALMTDARKVVAAVEPDRVRSAVSDLADTAAYFKTKSKDVDDILGGGKRAMTDIESFTGVLNRRSEDVDKIITDAKAIADTLKAASARVDGVLGGVEDMVKGADGKGLVAEATAAARAIREAAQAFEQRAAQIAGGIDRITGKGLREIEGLVTDGRRALSAVERAAGEIERNPQRFIFGGTRVPEYSPNRR